MILLGHEAHLAEGLGLQVRHVAVPARGGLLPDVMGPGDVYPIACGLRPQEVEQVRRHLPADRGDAEGRERHDEGVELADPVDQPITAGITDQDVESRAAENAVLVDDMCVGCFVRAALRKLPRRICRRVRIFRPEYVVGVQQVVAPPAVHVIPSRPAEHPVVALVAEHDVVAVGVSWFLLADRVAVRGKIDVTQHARTFVGDQVEEVRHEAGRKRITHRPKRIVRPPNRPVRLVEQDHPAWVVLVVEQEFAQPAPYGFGRVPRVGVLAELQDVARVPGTREVGAHHAVHQVPVIIKPLGVALLQRLPAAHRVVAPAAVHEVLAQPAEHDVVGKDRVEQRIVGLLVVWRQVVRSEVHRFLQFVGDVDVLDLHVAGGVDVLAQHVALAGASVRISVQKFLDTVEVLGVSG